MMSQDPRQTIPVDRSQQQEPGAALDLEIRTIPLTPNQRTTLMVPLVGWAVVMLIGVVALLVGLPAPLPFRLLIAGCGLALLLIGLWTTGRRVRLDLQPGTAICRPLPLADQHLHRSSNGTTYRVRFGDVITTTINPMHSRSLALGDIYWVTYSPQTQRIWDIQPYLPGQPPRDPPAFG